MSETINNDLKNDVPSINLTHSVRSIWTSIGQLNDFVVGLVAENKELGMRAGEIEKLWKRYNEIKQNLPQLEEKAAITDNLVAENARLKIENNSLRNEVNELKEIEKNFGLSQQEFVNKNKLLAENVDTINKLKEKISEYESRILELNKQMEEVKQEELVLKLENTLAESEARTLTEISEIETKFKTEIIELKEKYENEINNIIASKRDIESKFTVLLETTTSQERMLNEYSQRLFDLNRGKAECDRAIKENTEIKANLQEKIEKYESQASELKRLNALTINQNEKITHLENELNSYEAQFWQSEDEKHELKAKIQEMLKFKEDNIEKIRSFNASTERINFLSRLTETKTKEIESLKQKLDFSNNSINDLKNTLKIKDNDITLLSEFKNQQLIITEENKLLKEGVKELKINLENLINDKSLLVSKLLESETMLKALNNDKDELMNRINNLKDELQTKNEDILNFDPVGTLNYIGSNISIDADEKERLMYLLDKYINKLEMYIEN